jgi:hypothetical protein
MFHSLNPKISIKIPHHNYPTKTNVKPKHNYPTKTNVKPKHNYPTKTTLSAKTPPHTFFKTKLKKFYIKISIDIPCCIPYASTI